MHPTYKQMAVADISFLLRMVEAQAMQIVHLLLQLTITQNLVARLIQLAMLLSVEILQLMEQPLLLILQRFKLKIKILFLIMLPGIHLALQTVQVLRYKMQLTHLQMQLCLGMLQMIDLRLVIG